jgi:hypothetical protein
MPNPQQSDLARSRRSEATAEQATPAKVSARKKVSGGGAGEPVGAVPVDNLPGHHPEVDQDKPLIPAEPYRVPDDSAPRFAPEPADDEPGVEVRYPFLFEPLLQALALPLGVLPRTSWVRVTDDDVEIRFGAWHVRTPRPNVAGCEVVEGPFNLLKVAGPPHVSLADRGVTFATNRRLGACIRFREPVSVVLPGRLLRHPAAVVTVADPYALVRHLG